MGTNTEIKNATVLVVNGQEWSQTVFKQQSRQEPPANGTLSKIGENSG